MSEHVQAPGTAEPDISLQTAEALIKYSELMAELGPDSPKTREYFAAHQFLPQFRELAEESQRLERLFSGREQRPSARPQASAPTHPEKDGRQIWLKHRKFQALLVGMGLGVLLLGILASSWTFEWFPSFGARSARVPDGNEGSGPTSAPGGGGPFDFKGGLPGHPDELKHAEGSDPAMLLALSRRLSASERQTQDAKKDMLLVWDRLRGTSVWANPEVRSICRHLESRLTELSRNDDKGIASLALRDKDPAVRRATVNFILVTGPGVDQSEKDKLREGLRLLMADPALEPLLREKAASASKKLAD